TGRMTWRSSGGRLRRKHGNSANVLQKSLVHGLSEERRDIVLLVEIVDQERALARCNLALPQPLERRPLAVVTTRRNQRRDLADLLALLGDVETVAKPGGNGRDLDG